MNPCTDKDFNDYRGWFLAAGVYNLIVGSMIILFPKFTLQALGITEFGYLPVWQVVGMFILVYAPAYFWSGKKPYYFRHLILTATLGKILGPVGFLWAAVTGNLPVRFGWLIIFNDLIWWPAFGSYLVKLARNCGGWKTLLSGN